MLKVSLTVKCDTVAEGSVYLTAFAIIIKLKKGCKRSEFHQLLQRTLAEKKWAVPTIRQPVKKEIRSGNGNVSFFL